MKARYSGLEPCPFCGGQVVTYTGIMGTELRFFKCTNRKCGATVSFDNQECNTQPKKAIERFNSRYKDS